MKKNCLRTIFVSKSKAMKLGGLVLCICGAGAIALTLFLCTGCRDTTSFSKFSKDLTTYTIAANLDYSAKTLHAEMNVNYHNTASADFDELKFHLYPNAFRSEASKYRAVSEIQKPRAYPNGFSEGGINVTAVSQNSEKIDYQIAGEDSNILVVPLKNTLRANDWAEIAIAFDLTIPNCVHRFGYGENTLNLGNWYPIACVFEDGAFVTDGYSSNGDPFYSEVANYLVTIEYPSDLTLASTGECVSESEQEARKTDIYSAQVVRDFAMVFCSEYEVASANVGDVQIDYLYFDDENAAKNLEVAVDAVATFGEMFGAYPYPNLRVAKADFLQGGMEYPNLVYISSDIDVETDYRNTIVHEIAHQWWYGVVGNDECEYAWIDEGLAEYSTALFYDQNPKYDRTSAQVLGEALSSYLLFCDVYRDVYDTLDTSMNRNIHDFNTETEYVYLTYVKGVLMFDSIAEMIGEAKVQKVLRYFYENNQFDTVTPADLIEAFEHVTHKKLASYIMSWLDGSVVLEELA